MAILNPLNTITDIFDVILRWGFVEMMYHYATSIILLSFDHLRGVFAGNFEAAVGDEREGNNKH